VTSQELSRALQVGRVETQTPAYQGRTERIERRPQGPLPADGPDAWTAPRRAFRFKVIDASGAEHWFYADHVDCTTGLGPGSLRDAGKVVEAGKLEAMLAANQILLGEDPDYVQKLKAGRILIWGGSPTGAWAAEPKIHLDGTEVVVLGDTRPPSDWDTLLREHAAVMEELASHPSDDVPSELVTRARSIEQQIAQAHSGMTLRRNQKPGAAYDKPLHGRAPSDVQIDFGSPTKISTTADGQVIVTVGQGDTARTSLYSQVVIAHGQNPGAPGGPGGILGPGAAPLADRPRELGEVPVGTIAMRPIWGPRRGNEPLALLGLESVSPPGIQLKGAAFASKRMSPWVVKSERAAFEHALDEIAGPGATTRDYGPVGDDSRGVAAGAEAQRDRIPRANEVLAAQAYRLPGPDHSIALDPDHPERWDDQIREYFAINLRANHQWVSVKRLGGGRSKAVVYRVAVDGNDVGVFKLFDKDGAADEQYVLQRLKEAHLTKLTPVRERGRVAVDKKTGFDGALLMDRAKGTSLREMIEGLPTEPVAREAAMTKLKAAMGRTAEGLAELHARFEHLKGGAPQMMTRESKLVDANKFLDKNFRPGGPSVLRVQDALGEADFQRVKAAVEGPLLADFLAAEVPATARHGDANAGNFIVDEGGTISVIDAGTMRSSLDEASGFGTKTGAADVAWLLGSLETLHPGALSPSEVSDLRFQFTKSYNDEFQGVAHRRLNDNVYEKAEEWYRLELEIVALKSDPLAKSRILSLLGLKV
jgi:aminoglycoside phosphotransferase